MPGTEGSTADEETTTTASPSRRPLTVGARSSPPPRPAPGVAAVTAKIACEARRRHDRHGRDGQADDHDERLDLGRPARLEARQEVRQELPPLRHTSGCSQGGSDVGVADVAARPRDDRQLLARPEAERPGRPRVQPDRPRRDLHHHQQRQPGSQPSIRDGVQEIFAGGVAQLEPACPGASQATARSTSDRPYAGSGTQDAFQKHLHGPDLRVVRQAPARRPPTASSSRRSSRNPDGDRLRLARTSPKAPRVPYKGVACTLRTPSRASTAAPQLLHGHPRARRRVRRRSGSTGSRHSERRRAGSSPPTGCRSTELSSSAGPAAPARQPRRHSAPSCCSARWRRWSSLLIAGMIIFVFAKAWPSFSHNGLAWFGSRRQRRRAARRTSSTRRPTPTHYVYTLHAWPLLYATIADHRRRGDHRHRLLAALGDLHRRVRAAAGCGGSSSRWSGCSPRCPR